MADLVQLTIACKGQDTTYKVRKGLGLQAICAAHETPIEFDCREADCGICAVTVLSGAEHLNPPTRAEADFLKAMHAKADERLACQCRVFGDVAVRVEDWD